MIYHNVQIESAALWKLSLADNDGKTQLLLVHRCSIKLPFSPYKMRLEEDPLSDFSETTCFDCYPSGLSVQIGLFMLADLL